MAQVIRFPAERGIRFIPLHRVHLVDEVRSDYVPPCVSPIAPERIARLVDPAEVEIYTPRCSVAAACNRNGVVCPSPSTGARKDGNPYGGRIGIAIMFVAAAFIGFALALGGF